MPKKPNPKETVTVRKQHYDLMKLKAGRYQHAKNILSLVEDTRLPPAEREQAIRDQLQHLVIIHDQHAFIPQKLNAIEKVLGIRHDAIIGARRVTKTVCERLDQVFVVIDAHHQAVLESYCGAVEEEFEEHADRDVDTLFQELEAVWAEDLGAARNKEYDAQAAAAKIREALGTAVKLNTDLMEVVNAKEKNR